MWNEMDSDDDDVDDDDDDVEIECIPINADIICYVNLTNRQDIRVGYLYYMLVKAGILKTPCAQYMSIIVEKYPSVN